MLKVLGRLAATYLALTLVLCPVSNGGCIGLLKELISAPLVSVSCSDLKDYELGEPLENGRGRSGTVYPIDIQGPSKPRKKTVIKIYKTESGETPKLGLARLKRNYTNYVRMERRLKGIVVETYGLVRLVDGRHGILMERLDILEPSSPLWNFEAKNRVNNQTKEDLAKIEGVLDSMGFIQNDGPQFGIESGGRLRLFDLDEYKLDQSAGDLEKDEHRKFLRRSIKLVLDAALKQKEKK